MCCNRFVFLWRFSSFNRLIVCTLSELISSVICFSRSGYIYWMSTWSLWTLLGICFSSTYRLITIVLIFFWTLGKCNSLFWWLNLSSSTMRFITFNTWLIAVKCLLTIIDRKLLSVSDRTIKIYWAFFINSTTVWYLYL